MDSAVEGGTVDLSIEEAVVMDVAPVCFVIVVCTRSKSCK